MKTGTRLFSILLALLLALPCGGTREAQAAVASCANGHNWSGWQGIGATCTEAGWQERFCYNCGTKERQTLPALGHSWNGGAVTAQPSCTSGGTRTYTCTRCGATRSEGTGALGHSYGGVQVTKPSTCATMGESFQVCSRCGDRITHVMPKNENHIWDEGVITKEPEGFTPGEKTYTCTLCGATRTEPVDPTGGVFSKLNSSLRNSPPSSGSSTADKLRIVTQPVGGTRPQGKNLPMTLEAAGGEEPYEYEWWYAPAMPHIDMYASAIAKIESALGQTITETIQQSGNALRPAMSAATAEWSGSHGLESMVSGVMEKNAAEILQMEAVPFNPNARRLGRVWFPEHNASATGYYWCVVYDSAGQQVTSNKVRVMNPLYIAEQPESKNIWGLGSVTLTCRAGGGSGQYGYSWYGEDGIAGKLLEDGPSFTVNQAGTYVCYAVDFSTAEMVESNIVQVYSDKATQVDLRPVITLQPSDVMLEYREDEEYKVTFTCEAISPLTGDDANLDYEWEVYSDTEGWRYAGITYKKLPFSKVQPGTICRCKVVDRTSGEYVYSDEAKVRVKLAVAEIKVKYDITETQNGTGRCLMDFRIVGGAPRYDILVIRVTERERAYIGDDGEIHIDLMGDSNVFKCINMYEGEMKNLFLQWGNCYFHSYGNKDWDAMTKTQNDAVTKDLRLYKFYLRVQDSDGQEAVSEVVEVPAKGKTYDKYGGSDATITFDW